MKFHEAVISLKYNRAKNYILAGSERFLKEYFIKKVKFIYNSCDIIEFFPENQQEAYNLINGGGVFSSDYILILYDFDKMETSRFENIFKAFDGRIILVLSEEADLKSRSMTHILSCIPVVECNEIKEYGSDYLIWISFYISEAGYKAQEGVSESILSKAGPNMFLISNELEKLFIVKTDKIITLSDVEKYVSKTAAGTFFELLEALLRKNVKKALAIFDCFSKTQDNFIDLVEFLGLYFEKMYRLLLLYEKKVNLKDIADIIGIPFYLVKQKYIYRALALGLDFFASKIDLLCNLDVQLRLFKGEKRIVFEKFILSFAD